MLPHQVRELSQSVEVEQALPLDVVRRGPWGHVLRGETAREIVASDVVGDMDSPLALVLVKFVGSYIDIAHLRGADRTEVARLPRDEHANIWCPTRCVAHFYGPVVPALEMLRRLPPPQAASAPHVPYQPPRNGNGEPPPLTINDAERAVTTIRPPRRTTTSGARE